MKRELTEKGKQLAELAKVAEANVERDNLDNPKAADTERATPTVTMGGILLMRRLFAGEVRHIEEEEVPFLHLWVSNYAKTKQGRREIAKIARKSPELIAADFYEWLFGVDFAEVQRDIEAIAEGLNRIAGNSKIMESVSGEQMEEDDPNAVG